MLGVMSDSMTARYKYYELSVDLGLCMGPECNSSPWGSQGRLRTRGPWWLNNQYFSMATCTHSSVRQEAHVGSRWTAVLVCARKIETLIIKQWENQVFSNVQNNETILDKEEMHELCILSGTVIFNALLWYLTVFILNGCFIIASSAT